MPLADTKLLLDTCLSCPLITLNIFRLRKSLPVIIAMCSLAPATNSRLLRVYNELLLISFTPDPNNICIVFKKVLFLMVTSVL